MEVFEEEEEELLGEQEEFDTESTQIEQDEGKVDESYLDSEGLLTAGIGHLLTSEEQRKYPKGTPVPEAIVKAWYAEDLREAKVDAEKFFTSENPEINNILTNMAFNLGATRLRGFKKFKAALKAGDLEEASRQMLDSKWSGQVHGRATRLAERMRNAG